MPLFVQRPDQCQPDWFLLLSDAVLHMQKSSCFLVSIEAFPVKLLVPCLRVTAHLMQVVVMVPVQLVPG